MHLTAMNLDNSSQAILFHTWYICTLRDCYSSCEIVFYMHTISNYRKKKSVRLHLKRAEEVSRYTFENNHWVHFDHKKRNLARATP